jgi:hypothetical protein
VDKLSLLEAVKKRHVPTSEEANELLALRSQYPYSQVLQALSAKVSEQHDLPGKQSELQRAAIYASDRLVLKEIMTHQDIHAPETVVDAPVPAEAKTTKDAEEGAVKESIDEPVELFDVADIIMKDLQKLHQSKHLFEMLFADQSSMSMPVTLPEQVVNDIAPPADPEAGTQGETPESGKSKRAKIIELAKSMKASTEPESFLLPVRRKKKDTPSDHFIEQIKTSKQEIEIETERQKEQIQIIDHFIKTQPSITSPKDKLVNPVTDLNSIKSGEFSDNIVSETLVEILVKQGKKDRAIEVLKKLIWKYPQKKAYFASQIEELKKS